MKSQPQTLSSAQVQKRLDLMVDLLKTLEEANDTYVLVMNAYHLDGSVEESMDRVIVGKLKHALKVGHELLDLQALGTIEDIPF